ncbi:MAG: NADH-quinone oxidoreductase subunit C [Nitrososphaerota archaeon]|nr:NADH-quinone oxidoreductase subunit C [Nitrososphaerota archaeon]
MSQAPAAPAAASQPRPNPEPIRAREFASKVLESFPEAKLEYAKERRLKLSIPASSAEAIGTFARDSLGFDHISTVSGVDWIAKGEFEVIYFIGTFRPGLEDFVLCLSERIPRENPVVPTLIHVWPGAEYHERETHEMFGINFQGHPSQAHLLLPEDWNDLPPLRKDYVSPGR